MREDGVSFKRKSEQKLNIHVGEKGLALVRTFPIRNPASPLRIRHVFLLHPLNKLITKPLTRHMVSDTKYGKLWNPPAQMSSVWSIDVNNFSKILTRATQTCPEHDPASTQCRCLSRISSTSSLLYLDTSWASLWSSGSCIQLRKWTTSGSRSRHR